MVLKIVWFVVCLGVGIFMCYMPGIEQRAEEKRKKRFAKLDAELYQILKQRKKEEKKNA